MNTVCPYCGQVYPIEQEHIGCTNECANCGKDFVVQLFQEQQTPQVLQPDPQGISASNPGQQAASASVEQPAPRMKTLVCEMCGSTNLLKQDGVFVCQSCGTKYSVEEAKKMMISGTVNVAGIVQIDNSAQVEKYLANARRALKQEDWEEVEEYYNLVEKELPTSIEAVFFSSFGRAMLSLTDTLYFKREQKFEVLIKSISVINDYYEETNEDKEAVLRLICKAVESMFSVTYVMQTRKTGKGDVGSDAWTRNLLISVKNAVLNEIRQIQTAHQDEAYLQELIDKLSTASFSGCYIATAVYGSYDCPQVWILRRYRDSDLASTSFGRAFIHAYYAMSPTLVRWFGQSPWFRNIWKRLLDRMILKLKSRGFSDTPYHDRIW